ncbi:Piso0_000558 [Yasminevirus sp. GU-2018]|uniref:Piso0_000558 n=1 Tax=Yasminevirus sp. GU-2018 TaxID=2420051 RepID=A0A5K0U8K5_9VIRU|nr:Piso0_000558 [Yasminevirus sp. GU-2018]
MDNQNHNHKQEKSEVVSGFVGGVSRALIGHPFDTIKVKIQTHPEVYKSSIECLRLTLKEGGFKALYKGVGVPVIANGLIVGTHFHVFNFLEEFLKQHKLEDFSVNGFVSGAVAGATGSIISSPVEYVRIKMQLANKLDNKKKYNSVLECVFEIKKNRGTLGLYHGYRITLLREVVGYGCFFTAYKQNMNHDGSMLSKITTGVVCGFALWGSMYPLDVIKSRVQGELLSTKSHSELYFAKVVHDMYGIRGFYKGFVPTMIRAVPVNIGIVMSVDYVNRIF